jgi:hypothetical protein
MNLPISIHALNPDLPLKKHTATIHIEAPFSAVDHKCLNILYKAAYEAAEWSTEFYYVKYSDVAKFLGWKRFVMKDIAETLEKLRVSKIKWNILSQDNKNDEKWDGIGVTGFISSYFVVEEHNVIRFSISPEIKRLIQNPNIFSYIDLEFQKKLKSKYDLILYEVLMDELTRSYLKSNISRWYTINDLRRLYGLSEESYSEPRDFNKFCIREPIKSINENTNIDVEICNTERVKRTIVALQFKVSFKGGDISIAEVQTSLAFDTDDNVMDKQYIAKDELTQICNSEKIADQIIDYVRDKYPGIDHDEMIKENIEYDKKNKEKKKIKSFVGYTRSAIENDYAQYCKKVKDTPDSTSNPKEENDKYSGILEYEIRLIRAEKYFSQLPTNIKEHYYSRVVSFVSAEIKKTTSARNFLLDYESTFQDEPDEATFLKRIADAFNQ